MSDLDAETVVPLLGSAWLGAAWRFVPSCESTNDEAAAWVRSGAPHGAVVVTDAQTRGRGRQGRSWFAPPGEALCMSVVLRLPLPPARLPPLTLAIGVAMIEAVARFDVAGGLKWPNDLFVDGKKAGGILTEAGGEAVIAGIGVNLNCAHFPPELSATSLKLARGRDVDRALFAAALCERLEHWVERFVDDGPPAVMAAWRSSSVTLGRRVTAGGTTGLAEDIEPDGRLRLRCDDGSVVRIGSGEVS